MTTIHWYRPKNNWTVPHRLNNVEVVLLWQPEDRKLLKEIGRNGQGRPVEIRQLIEEVFAILLHW